MTVMFDDNAITSQIKHKFQTEASESDSNHLMGSLLDLVTTPMRRFGDVNSSYRKIATSLVCFRR